MGKMFRHWLPDSVSVLETSPWPTRRTNVIFWAHLVESVNAVVVATIEHSERSGDAEGADLERLVDPLGQ